MDWETNQRTIRTLLDRVETLTGKMVCEEDPEVRMEMCEYISQDIYGILTRTESMTRWLKKYEMEDE